jgi:hypothetical protein
MSYQGKSKRHYDAAEFMAFIGVIGAGVSIIGYIIFAFIMIGCSAPEVTEPVSVTKLTKVYTIHVQPNGSAFNPKYLPNLK